jgi:hypothetical protein
MNELHKSGSELTKYIIEPLDHLGKVSKFTTIFTKKYEPSQKKVKSWKKSEVKIK